jgi:putative ABC transport system permease protein
MSAPAAAARWVGSWRAALRISRREVLRHRARNLLIVLMLALPVFGATAVETVLQSTTDLSVQERLTRTLGETDAYVQPTAGQPVYQSTSVTPDSLPTDWAEQVASNGQQSVPQPSEQQQLDGTPVQQALPQATLLPEVIAWGVFMHGPAGYATPVYDRLDVSNPKLGGAFDLLSGRLPHSVGEVDITPTAARELGAVLGSTVTLPASSAVGGAAESFTVVGTMRQPSYANLAAVYALPAAAAAKGQQADGWFVLNPGGVSWSQVQRLNQGGFVATSRVVVDDPPPSSQVPYSSLNTASPYRVGPTSTATSAAVAAIVAGIALLEVVLLAGPAFAVSARRREHEYAMLGATGADGRQLRRIVLADGLVLGAVAGVCGALLGFGVGAASLSVIAEHQDALPGHVHVGLWRVLGVIVLAMFLGVCSALVPARSAARRDIMATLSGRRIFEARRVRAGRTVLGLVLAVAGLCGIFEARTLTPSSPALYTVAGVALVEIGAILCTSTIVRLVASAGGILPLGPRLALRDSARHTGRTTPAVAAMFAAVAGAVAAGAWLDSSLTQARDSYEPTLLPNQVAVAAVTGTQQAQQITDKLKDILPIENTQLSRQMPIQGEDSNGNVTWNVYASVPGQNRTVQLWGYGLEQDVVGGPQALQEVTGIDDARADTTLQNGGVVVFSPGLIADGHITFVLQRPSAAKNGAQAMVSTDVSLPAAYVDPTSRPDPGMVIAPAAAARLAVPGGDSYNLLIDLSRHVTANQEYAANQTLTGMGVHSGLTVEDGFSSKYSLANVIMLLVAMVLAIAAAAIATGLALADGRADHETLTAVGGSPWTRRWLAGSTALVITGLGVLIGVPVGFAIATGLARVQNPHVFTPDDLTGGQNQAMRFVVPWLDLGAVALAVPLLTALGAALLSRSTTPRARRIEF